MLDFETSDDSGSNNEPEKTQATPTLGSETGYKSTTTAKRLYNPLRDYSSSTYKISLYAITPEALNSHVSTGIWKTNELELMIQSGGITSNLDSPRNKFFNYDFGIDDLDITTLTNAKDSGYASNSVDFKFKIYEPYAMTFPTRLLALQKELQKKANMDIPLKQQIQALAIPLLLVVRFYGYDVNGEIVTNTSNITPNTQTQTDDKAAFERAWPIQITKLNFRLENKVTVYDMQAKTINEQAALGAKRGIIPTNITILADTVESAFGGLPNSKGLVDQLNNLQNSITNTEEDRKKQRIPDVYKIKITDTTIKESLIVDKDFYVKSRAPLAQVKNSAQSTVRTSALTSTVDKKNRVIDIASGTSILTAIDQIISQSTYLRDALKVTDKEVLQTPLENQPEYDTNTPKPLYWYCVVPEVKIIDFDKLRNDYAFEITYVIYKYSVPYVKSLVNGSTTTYSGPSKIYDYWYTGKNTEIISYEQQYNMLYFLGAALSSESGTPENSSDVTPNKAIPGQNANPTGKESGKLELQNSIKTFLYSPGDQIKAQIKILGDPDYLMPIGGPVTDDFTINPNTGQVFIEIDFKQVEDYNSTSTGIGENTVVDDGLLKPNNNLIVWDYPPVIKKATEGRMVFMVTRVTSRFSKGTFTQDLKTILPNFPGSEDSVVDSQAADEERQDVLTLDSNNQSVSTIARTGTLLNSTAGAGRSSREFAEIDTRRTDRPTGTEDDSENSPQSIVDDSGREEPIRIDLERGTRGGA